MENHCELCSLLCPLTATTSQHQPQPYLTPTLVSPPGKGSSSNTVIKPLSSSYNVHSANDLEQLLLAVHDYLG